MFNLPPRPIFKLISSIRESDNPPKESCPPLPRDKRPIFEVKGVPPPKKKVWLRWVRVMALTVPFEIYEMPFFWGRTTTICIARTTLVERYRHFQYFIPEPAFIVLSHSFLWNKEEFVTECGPFRGRSKFLWFSRAYG